jgi:hypothetical protein
VTFQLTRTKLVHPAALTLDVDQAALTQAGNAASRPDAAWLAFYDAAGHRWQHVNSRYDPVTHFVTAQVPHLSTWNPFTWDWGAIALRLRQSLSAFGSGRAPSTECPKVQGITVTTTGGNDPPLIGCITGDAASGFNVDLTNNRAYSAIVQAPAGLSQAPRDFAGFEEFVQSSDSVTEALGGPYLAPVSKVTYGLPATGTTFVFKDAASLRTVVLDMGIAAAMAVFDRVTLGYGSCILDAVVHSGAATLNEAPGLVDECFPKLMEGITQVVPGLGWIATAAQTVGLFIQEALISSDYVFDAALKRHGQVTITRTVDWYNTSYMMSCGGLAPQPFTVNVQGGKATAPGSSGGYSTYEVHVEAVTQPGALTSDGSPQTAVLLYCSPQPSNFFVEEVQVFKSDGGLLGELPPTGTLSPGSSLPPQYDSSQFSISTGQLITGMKFYAPTDSHASGPSIHQVLKWSWDGHQFIHDPFTLPQASPSTSCPAVGAGVPAGLGSAVQQQIGNVCGLEIGQVKVDPRDPSWVTFLISPTPGSTVQGGGGIAHEVNGSWPVVLTGSSMYWCDPRVPSQVVADFGLSCP